MTRWNGRFNPETAAVPLDSPCPAPDFKIMSEKELLSFSSRFRFPFEMELGKLIA